MINQMPGIASHTLTDSEIANIFYLSQRFAFDKSFTDPWWVAGGILRILKCLGRFEV